MVSRAARVRVQEVAPNGYLSDPGVLSWLFSLDHKRVAVQQLFGVALLFALGGALGAALGWESLLVHSRWLAPATHGGLLTLHGSVMAMAVLLPLIPGVLGSFLLPLQLGAKNVAFPRLHLAALHTWFLGALMLLQVALSGAPATGWSLLPPESLEATGPVDLLALALLVLAISALLRALVFMVTVHAQRARGLRWSRLTPFVWGLYAQSAVVTVAAPVWSLSLLLLLSERISPVGFFAPTLGGDPRLYQHLFWFGAHGLLYSAALPALGIVAQVLADSARRPLFERRLVLLGIAVLAPLMLMGWGQHLSPTGGSLQVWAFFSLAALATVVPMGWFILSWVGTLRRGVASYPPALWLALSAATAWVIGGLSGALQALPSLAPYLHGTRYTIGHSHYLLVGGVLLSALAGLHHWWPKVTGRAAASRASFAGAALWLLGVHAAFLPQLVLGTRGIPRRLQLLPQAYDATWQTLSFVGMLLLTAASLTTLWGLWRSLKRPRLTEDNPYASDSLEWRCGSPPPIDNFQ